MKSNVNKACDDGYIIAVEGVKRKTLVYGDNTLLTEFRLEQGNVLPAHHHPQEQTGYLVSGHILLTIGDLEYDIRPGDSWIIPGDIKHSAKILDDSVAIEVFSPVRRDYIPQ